MANGAMAPLGLLVWLSYASAQSLPGYSGQDFAQHFRQMDGNGDTKVDFEEIRAYGHHKIIAREYLNKLDTNKDTWLTLEEYTKGGGVGEPAATADEAARRLNAAKPPPAAAPPPPPPPVEVPEVAAEPSEDL